MRGKILARAIWATISGVSSGQYCSAENGTLLASKPCPEAFFMESLADHNGTMVYRTKLFQGCATFEFPFVPKEILGAWNDSDGLEFKGRLWCPTKSFYSTLDHSPPLLQEWGFCACPESASPSLAPTLYPTDLTDGPTTSAPTGKQEPTKTSSPTTLYATLIPTLSPQPTMLGSTPSPTVPSSNSPSTMTNEPTTYTTFAPSADNGTDPVSSYAPTIAISSEEASVIATNLLDELATKHFVAHPACEAGLIQLAGVAIQNNFALRKCSLQAEACDCVRFVLDIACRLGVLCLHRIRETLRAVEKNSCGFMS